LALFQQRETVMTCKSWDPLYRDRLLTLAAFGRDNA
jgi:hypothetical protein